MRTLPSLLLGAALALAGLPAAAQAVGWARSRPFAFQFNPDMVRTVAAPTADNGAWWSAPDQHHYNYGQDELASVRVTRLDNNGNATVQHLIQGNLVIEHLIGLPDGGVCLTGGFRDSLVLDARHRLQPTHVNLTYFMARLDPTGQVAWLRPLRAPSTIGTASADGLALDPRNGDIWVGSDIYSDSYLTRYDATTGDSLLSYVQHDAPRITSLTVAPDGSIYTAGSCAGSAATYNGFSAPTSLTYSDYIACYGPSGQCRWVRYVESITCGQVFVSTADSAGVYMAGDLFGVKQFGSISIGRSTGLFGNYYLTRLDRTTGTFQWVHDLPGIANNTLAPLGALATDVIGRVWLLTTLQGAAVTWPNGLTLTPQPAGSVMVVCYDSQGTLNEAFINDGSRAHALAINIPPGSLSGTISGVAPVGGIQWNTASLPASVPGTPLPFVANLWLFPPLQTPAPLAGPVAASVYPNPVAAGSRLTVGGPGAGWLEIRDATGRLVQRHAIGSGSATLTAPARAGMYLVRTLTADQVTTQRLVVE